MSKAAAGSLDAATAAKDHGDEASSAKKTSKPFNLMSYAFTKGAPTEVAPPEVATPKVAPPKVVPRTSVARKESRASLARKESAAENSSSTPSDQNIME
jgi:hypothetical protein